MISAHLMSYFMHDIINIEIIALRYSVGRRSNSASFHPVNTNAADTARVSAAARSAEHMTDVIIRLADD